LFVDEVICEGREVINEGLFDEYVFIGVFAIVYEKM